MSHQTRSGLGYGNQEAMTTSASTPQQVGGPSRQARNTNQEVDLRATIAEEVSRALREAVPMIVEQNRDIIAKMMEERLNVNRRTEEVNENMDQLQIEQQRGDETNQKDGCSYKYFLSCKPPEFKGSGDPVISMRWLKEMENVFKTSKCSEGDKVMYAVTMLKDEALYWWDMVSGMLGEGIVGQLTWGQFIAKFKEDFISESALDQIEEEFLTLKQGESSVVDYTYKFMEKARFVEHQIPTEKKKIKRYVWGLRANIREFVSNRDLATFRQVVEAAKEREKELNFQKHEMSSVVKRKRDDRTYESSKKLQIEGGSRKSDKQRDAKWCEKYNRKHIRECTPEVVECCRCGKGDDQFSWDYNHKNKICYECSLVGHVRVDYPKLKKREPCSKVEVVRCRRGTVKEERDFMC
ncbi:uncharacterized protein LOC111912373 [Lactuca sativa]|uniref:uncharacterized protein LOC111912373 n=1 Tax=Lactuca sativa TaxID=4236 RepID=UPI000CD8B213|nr:uncharacterized protein LOC111912373 [Lactuca sativa]